MIRTGRSEMRTAQVEVRAKIKTRTTRGLDQGQASGQVRFSAKVEGRSVT